MIFRYAALVWLAFIGVISLEIGLAAVLLWLDSRHHHDWYCWMAPDGVWWKCRSCPALSREGPWV